MTELNRCRECVLPVTTPGLDLDEDGVCNYCREHEPFPLRGEEALLEALEDARAEGAAYDCEIIISGGRDSSYALWLLAEHYGLRVLAVHYDNPFAHPQAYANVKRATDRLDVPLVVVGDREDVHVRCFRNNVRAFFRRPRPAMISMMCLGCKNILRYGAEVARERGAPLIVTASTPYEQLPFKKALQGVPLGASHLRLYASRFWTGLTELALNPGYLTHDTLAQTARTFANLDIFSPAVPFLYPDVRFLCIFYYLRWDEPTVLRTVREELGWSKPEDTDSPWRFDCRIGPLKDFLYRRMLGLTEKESFYSVLIREGIIGREDALERLAREREPTPEESDECLRPAGLSLKELMEANPRLWEGAGEAVSNS